MDTWNKWLTIGLKSVATICERSASPAEIMQQTPCDAQEVFDGEMNHSMVFLELKQAFELHMWLNPYFKSDDFKFESQ